jgi:hypothetical protein
MNDDDIRAFGAGPALAAGAATRQRRRLWPWLLGGLLVLALLATGALAALWTVADSAQHGLHVIVNGQPWDGWDAWDGTDWEINPRHGLAAGLAVLLAVSVLLLVVPFAVLLGLALSLAGIAIGLAATVGALGLAAAVLLSPLWGVGLLLWLMLRRRSPPTAAHGARMTA